MQRCFSQLLFSQLIRFSERRCDEVGKISSIEYRVYMFLNHRNTATILFSFKMFLNEYYQKSLTNIYTLISSHLFFFVTAPFLAGSTDKTILLSTINVNLIGIAFMPFQSNFVKSKFAYQKKRKICRKFNSNTCYWYSVTLGSEFDKYFAYDFVCDWFGVCTICFIRKWCIETMYILLHNANVNYINMSI